MYAQFATVYTLAQEREEEIRAMANQPQDTLEQQHGQNWLAALRDRVTGRTPAVTYSAEHI